MNTPYRLYELDIRLPLIVGGLEALVNTEKNVTGWQFQDRVIRLAAKFSVPLTEDELQTVYLPRSKLVHAQNFRHSLGGFVPVVEQPILNQKLENLPRQIVKEFYLSADDAESSVRFFRYGSSYSIARSRISLRVKWWWCWNNQSEEERILWMRLSAAIVRLSFLSAVLKGHSLYGIP